MHAQADRAVEPAVWWTSLPRAARQPDGRAFTFLTDEASERVQSLTYGELDLQAREIGAGSGLGDR